jgi:hypothetical protein
MTKLALAGIFILIINDVCAAGQGKAEYAAGVTPVLPTQVTGDLCASIGTAASGLYSSGGVVDAVDAYGSYICDSDPFYASLPQIQIEIGGATVVLQHQIVIPTKSTLKGVNPLGGALVGNTVFQADPSLTLSYSVLSASRSALGIPTYTVSGTLASPFPGTFVVISGFTGADASFNGTCEINVLTSSTFNAVRRWVAMLRQPAALAQYGFLSFGWAIKQGLLPRQVMVANYRTLLSIVTPGLDASQCLAILQTSRAASRMCTLRM